MVFKESETIELKRNLTPEIKKEIVAFANSGGGTIYVGIEDNGTIYGIDAPEKAEQQLSSIVHDAIKPDLTMFTSCRTKVYGGKQVLEITVQRGTDRPYYLTDKGLKPSGVYIRLGNTSIPATETAIRNMIVETDGTKFEAIRSLNQSLTFEYAAKEFQKREVEFQETQYKTLGILNSDGIYTNLGLLISDQCLHTIKIAVFEGIDKNVFKDRREFGGTVLKQLADTFEYIDLHNHTRATFSGLNRIDAKDYSDSVIREALLNAIIHRDYSFSGSILVSIFDDRIEIASIGGLVPGLSINDIMLGISQSRNEKLAAIFYQLRLVESYGTGIGKIRKDYEGTNLVPGFTATDGAFLLVLPNKNRPRENKTTNGQALTNRLDDELENGILELITLTGCITRKEIEDKLGLKQTKAGLILRQMEAESLITRTGSGKNTRYFRKE